MRLSNGIRNVEDGVAIAASRLVRGAKGFAQSVAVEYRARQLHAAEQSLRKQLNAYQRMSPAQKAAHVAQQIEIERRLAALRASREAPITND